MRLHTNETQRLVALPEVIEAVDSCWGRDLFTV